MGNYESRFFFRWWWWSSFIIGNQWRFCGSSFYMIILHREKCWGKVIRWDIRITIVWIWKWIVLRSMVYDNDWAIIALWLIITLFRWTRTCWCSVAGCWRAREPTVGTPIIIAHPWCGWYWWCWCRLIIALFLVKFW